jgi:PTH1 family peptidyl-tRNA hydrolase
LNEKEHLAEPVAPIRLVVGLGNPGQRYQNTRHNIGFMVVEALADGCGIAFSRRSGELVYGSGRIGNDNIYLAKPLAYMNKSGVPTQALARRIGIDLQEMLVIHDDIDLVFGRLKIKKKGGSGGHNGIKSLKAAFGGGDFTRLRIGVGRPEAEENVTRHVLGRFSRAEKEHLGAVIETAQKAVMAIIEQGAAEAMNQFNGKGVIST